MDTLCRRFLISGNVQGVFFRASTRDQANSLGVTGYAKNLENGGVEVVGCGDEKALNALEKWLWQGPPHAQVTEISIKSLQYISLESFETY